MENKKGDFELVYFCISCEYKYQTNSIIRQNDIKVEVCGNCHPFYNDKIEESKIGKAEIFRKKLQKTTKKSPKI